MTDQHYMSHYIHSKEETFEDLPKSNRQNQIQTLSSSSLTTDIEIQTLPPMAAAALLLFLTALLSLSVSSSSRPLPCNTLLISYSFTSYSSDSSSLSFYRPSTFITVYRIISPLRSSNLDRQSHSHPVQIQRSQRPSSAHLASSLQDRARDILAVAAGLLFGVGCGALTAATLYFLFAVATNRYALLGSHYDDDEDEIDEYDEIPSPKKGVYVAIPVEETTADVKVKEGFEKN